jgi:uncharacterized protein
MYWKNKNSYKDLEEKIHLTEKELESITTLFQQTFTAKDHLWIFGSRVNLARQGGDIDLYIETEEIDYDTVLRQKMDFAGALQAALGEQTINIVIKVDQEDVDLPIYTVAKETGVLLV